MVFRFNFFTISADIRHNRYLLNSYVMKHIMKKVAMWYFHTAAEAYEM